jgi:hypothetical protein
MKIAKSAVALSLLFVLITIGCVHSMNPFYREKDVVFDAALLGRWCESREANSSDTNRATWTFAASEGKSYHLTLSGLEKGELQSMEFDVHLFQFDGQRFLDVFPAKEEIPKPSEKYGWLGFFRPTHTVVHLPKSDKELVMKVLAAKELEAYVKKHPRLSGVEEYEGRLLLTGSTRQLQQFLRESIRRTNWWDDGGRLTRCVP